MAKKGKTQYVLLGLIAAGPKTGYEIKHTIERSIGFFWQESFGQIYPTLHSLSEKKYITKKSVSQGGRPNKIIYSITNAGSEYFKTWLASSFEPASQRNEMLLRLFFGPVSNIIQNIQLLENHVNTSTELYQLFLHIQKDFKENCVLDSGPIENSTYSMLTLEYGIMSLKMEIEWAKKSIKQLKQMNAKSKEDENA